MSDVDVKNEESGKAEETEKTAQTAVPETSGKKKKEKKKLGFFQKLLIAVIVIVAIPIVYFLGAMIYMNATEYKPADVEEIEITGLQSKELDPGDELTILTWNVGFGALGDNADFFMDGGKMVKTASKERVKSNVSSIIGRLQTEDTDVIFLQEVDVHSARSYRINMVEEATNKLSGGGYENTFAYNFKVNFLPYPPLQPMGEIKSGLSTWSKYDVESSERIKLPCPFKWPTRAGNLKRCLMVDRLPVDGTDKELVLINLHLEAYDSGEGKVAQTKMLKDLLEEEIGKGNYVIAGGDFNQTFSNADIRKYPVLPGKWEAGTIDIGEFDSSLQFIMPTDTPSCRSLDQPLADAVSRDPKYFQYYVIDGFIVSDNLEVESCEVRDLGFVNSDHNPVVMKVRLKK